MKILALEFSSPQRSVAVVSGPEAQGTKPKAQSPKPESSREVKKPVLLDLPALCATSAVCVSEVVETGRTNTMRPLGMAEEALKQAGLEREQIECLVVGTGPGSYTGVRAAISLAQGWQLARGVKLLGISSAECVAAQAQAEGLRGRTGVVIDAQRGECYLADYELGPDDCRELAPLRLATLAEAHEWAQAGGILTGPEVTRWFTSGRIIFPRAATLGRLALTRKHFVPGEKLEPVYLRETNYVKAPPHRPRIPE